MASAWSPHKEELQQARRVMARYRAQRKRPRCAICPNPLPYGKNGFNLRATTCSRKCSYTRWNWFKRRAA